MTPKKSQRPMLLVLSIVGIFFVLLRIMLMRDNLKQAIDESANTGQDLPVETRDASPSVPVAAPPNMDRPAEPSPAGEASLATPRAAELPTITGIKWEPLYPSQTTPDEANGNEERHLTSFRPPTGSTAIGVVDLERLLSAHRSGADSADARAGVLRHIRRIVAFRAATHGFAYVLDSSAMSWRLTPLLLATNGVPDITDEVLQELSQ